MDPKELGSATLVASWLQKSLPEFLTKQQKDNVKLLFEWLVSLCLPVNCRGIGISEFTLMGGFISGTTVHSICHEALSSNGSCVGDAPYC